MTGTQPGYTIGVISRTYDSAVKPTCVCVNIANLQQIKFRPTNFWDLTDCRELGLD
jgi:hypothetical protein